MGPKRTNHRQLQTGKERKRRSISKLYYWLQRKKTTLSNRPDPGAQTFVSFPENIMKFENNWSMEEMGRLLTPK